MADYSLFEQGDLLKRPIECFTYDAKVLGLPVKAHWHYYAELIILEKGHLLVHTEKSVYHVGPGNTILFHPEVIHDIYQDPAYPNDEVYYIGLKFDINHLKLTPSYAPKLRSIFRSARKHEMSCVFTPEQTKQYHWQELTKHSAKEAASGRYGCDLIQMMNVSQILIGVLRCWQDDGFAIDNEAYLTDSQHDIFTITEYIDEHLSEGIHVDEIASMCNMSYSCFAKKFHSIYGETCKGYIENMRIYKVEEFLRYTDFDLNYISQETGFSDCSHMIKCFRKAKGVTPGQYRAAQGYGTAKF